MSIIISDKSFKAFFSCKYKSWLLLQNIPGEITSYEKYQIKKLTEYKFKAYEIFSKMYEPNQIIYNPINILDLNNNSYRLLINISICNEKYKLNIDALEKVFSSKKTGICDVFTPIFLHDKVKLHVVDRVLFGFQIFALSEMMQKTIDNGIILTGVKYKKIMLQFNKYKEKIKKILKEIKSWEEISPSICLNKHCKICEFKKTCLLEATKIDHLSLIDGINQTEIKNWNDRGIFTVTQLSYNFHPRRKGKRVNNTTPKRYHALKALAIRDNKIYIFENPQLPKTKIKIFLDVEYKSEDNFYYLIGFKVSSEKLTKRYSLWANDKSYERKNFRKFLQIMKSMDDYTVFHYGSLEKKFFRKIQKLAADKDDLEIINNVMNNSCNVLSFLYSYIYFPTYSNGLKEIANFLGFKWESQIRDGLLSTIWRDKWEKKRTKNLKEELLLYNSDDQNALELVYKSICGIVNYNKIRLEDRCIEAIDTQKLKNNSSYWGKVRFGKIEFALEELEYINKCSYFDYQKDKVKLRNNKKILSKFGKNKNILKISPNKVRIYNCRKCRYCQSHRLIKDPQKLKDKISYDLKLTKNGIKKWITRHVAHTFKCLDCNKSFYSKNFSKNKIPKYEHNLRSWIVYQYTINRLSYQNIQRYIQDIFGFNMHYGAISKAKNECVKKYIKTYKSIIKSIVNSQLIHIDETKINMKVSSGYIWVLANSYGVAYIARPNREADFLTELLRRFKGILISDFFSGYESINCTQQKCLVHLIRDLNRDLLDNPFDEEYKIIVYKFTLLLKKVIDTIDLFGLRKRNLNKHKKDVNSFYKFLYRNKFASDLAIKYQKRFIKNNEKLFTFLSYNNVPWNNNSAENAIKYIAKWRRLVKGRITETGLSEYCIFLTIYQTCERNKINFLAFLLSKKQYIESVKKNINKSVKYKEGKMFIRTKKIYKKDGTVREYETLVETYKHDGKVKQKHLMSLGKKGEIDPKRIEKIIRTLIKKTPNLTIVKSEITNHRR